jgi:hypothetical protein
VRLARDRFVLYQMRLWVLFVAALAGGFAVAITGGLRRYRERKAIEVAARSQAQPRPTVDSPRPSSDDPDIHWIGTAKSMQRRMLLVCLLVGAGGSLLVVAVMSGTSGEMRDGSSLIMFLPVFIFTIASIATFVIGRRMLTTMRIGALREWLLVRNWRSRVAIGVAMKSFFRQNPSRSKVWPFHSDEANT